MTVRKNPNVIGVGRVTQHGEQAVQKEVEVMRIRAEIKSFQESRQWRKDVREEKTEIFGST